MAAVPNGLVIRNDALPQEIARFASQGIVHVPSKRERTSEALSRSKNKSLKLFRLRSSEITRCTRPKSKWEVCSLGGLFSKSSKRHSADSLDEFVRKKSSWHCSAEECEIDNFSIIFAGRSASLPELSSNKSEWIASNCPVELHASFHDPLIRQDKGQDSTIEGRPSPTDSVVEEWPPPMQMTRQTQVKKIERDVTSPMSENEDTQGHEHQQLALHQGPGTGNVELSKLVEQNEKREEDPPKSLGRRLGLSLPSGNSSQKERESVALDMLNDTFLL